MSRLRPILLRLAFALVFFLASLEVCLHLFADKLPPSIHNDMVDCYSSSWGGMYYVDHPSKMNLMIPNRRMSCLFHGIRWTHESDARGFRNPPGTASEVLLLGDSFIYGHCVEEKETLGAVLRRDHGWKVYNMARQGDALSEEYLRFRLYFDELKPKKVILCVFVNDFGDVSYIRSPEEMRQPAELSDEYVDALRQRLNPNDRNNRACNWINWSYTYRLVGIVGHILKVKRQPPPPPDQKPTPAPWIMALKDPTKFADISGYYRLLIADMQKRCQKSNCQLEILYVDTATNSPEWEEPEALLEEFLRKLCSDYHLHFMTTADVLKGHPEYVIPGDGHLNAAGHKAVADYLAKTSRPL